MADQLNSNSSIINVFKEKFASTVHQIYIPSLGKNVNFKEINVVDQKTISKIYIENSQRSDILFDAYCALINRLSLDSTFNIYDLTEFDRIRILLDLYQSNYLRNGITYTCKACGTENKYELDFSVYAKRLEEIDLKDKTCKLSVNNLDIEFTLNWPLVKTVSNFHKEFFKHNKKALHGDSATTQANLLQTEYLQLFIKHIKIVDNSVPDANPLEADLTTMPYTDSKELLSALPQYVLFSDQDGVMQYITNNISNQLDNVFKYERCAQCGVETNEGLGSVTDFFQ